jgi:shikimate kinase
MIFLIGLSGVGKTHWAAKLAAANGWLHYDTDIIIEQLANKTTSQIFAEDGEAAFRQYEKEVLGDIIRKNEKCIVSCGGGLPVFYDNMNSMLHAGCVIYLQASPAYIAKQVADTANRPLLHGDSLIDKLQTMLQARKKIYERAHHAIDAEQATMANFEEIMSKCIQML